MTTAAVTEEKKQVDLVNVQIDGQWMQVPKGIRIIEAIKLAGKFVPHYCYHPKLSSPGNCRMCLVEMGMPKMGPDRKPITGADGQTEIGWIARPAISCANTVAEGMGVRTDSPMVQECQKGVMELLLINHPLDCPICDEAGECKLQEYSVEYGNANSRFVEEKVKKPKKVDLGPTIILDDERCILCSRCVRFCNEIAKDDVLGFVNRGSFNTLTCHPGKKLENNYSLNTVDICPVGALTSKDFRFKMRVWFLKETESICTSCGTGCNTMIGSREGVIYRQVPRDNDAVNSSWMCDFGRLNYKFVNDEKRLGSATIRRNGSVAQVSAASALGEVKKALKGMVEGELAIVASGRMTNEELFLVKKLAQVLKVELVDIVHRSGPSDDILLSADRNPNTNGARMLGIAADDSAGNLTKIRDAVAAGRLSGLLVFGEDVVEAGFDPEALKKLKFLCSIDMLPNKTTDLAHYVLPGVSWAEKRGTMVNIKGRLQRLNKAVEPVGGSVDNWELLNTLLTSLGGTHYEDVASVFVATSESVPQFAELTLAQVGAQGVNV
mgnify:CR=1 FL=1